jgi:outer membrane biosynthesis protein TonB
MRLPNNAYDALRNHTQELLDSGTPHSQIFEIQLTLLNNIPIFKEEVSRLRMDSAKRELSEYARSRLLRLPAVGLRIPGQNKSLPTQPAVSSQTATTSNSPAPVPAGNRVYPNQNRTPATTQPEPQPQTNPSPPPPQSEASEKQKAQRAEYIRMQRDREASARAERERIKAQIRADREERRRLDEMRKQAPSQQDPTDRDPSAPSSSTYARSASRPTPSAEVRVQVRTFDGSTLRTTLPSTSTITTRLRPWIDSTSHTSIPYNLKLILTPLPNRTIEAGEEDTSLSDLGIVASCTFVMVPVRGYVESYSSGGLLGQNGLLGGVGGMVSGGYNLVSGTAGWALGGVRSFLGYAGEQQQQGQMVGGNGGGSTGPGPASDASGGGAKNVRIRTLADQRAEAERRNQQFYNGNTLNFEPKRDEDGKKD